MAIGGAAAGGVISFIIMIMCADIDLL